MEAGWRPRHWGAISIERGRQLSATSHRELAMDAVVCSLIIVAVVIVRWRKLAGGAVRCGGRWLVVEKVEETLVNIFI